MVRFQEACEDVIKNDTKYKRSKRGLEWNTK